MKSPPERFPCGNGKNNDDVRVGARFVKNENLPILAKIA
jgi:hypothetical protein